MMSEDGMKPLTYHTRRGCPICVESRGVDDRHSSVVQFSSENTELQVQVDYMFFIGDMDLAKLKCSQQVAVPVLVATCNEQPAEIFAIACPRKGEHAYVQKTFGNYLRRLQRTKITSADRSRGGHHVTGEQDAKRVEG